MCTPIGHALVGYSMIKNQSEMNPSSLWLMVVQVLLISNLPDIDFLFGFAVGNPNRFHHLWTHSLMFAIMAGGLYGMIYTLFTKKNGFKVGLMVAGIVCSHLLLDFLSKDTREPCGMPLFWPFSQAFFLSPVPLFSDISKSSSSGTFLGSLFCLYNLRTVMIEVALLSPLGIWIFLSRRKAVNKLRVV